jgi:hypothetical protein
MVNEILWCAEVNSIEYYWSRMFLCGKYEQYLWSGRTNNYFGHLINILNFFTYLSGEDILSLFIFSGYLM